MPLWVNKLCCSLFGHSRVCKADDEITIKAGQGIIATDRIESKKEASLLVTGTTEGRNSEIPGEVKTVSPGDWAYMKVFKRKLNELRRTGAYELILGTPTAVMVKGKSTWSHFNHCQGQKEQ